jgi:hypothetical protein
MKAMKRSWHFFAQHNLFSHFIDGPFLECNIFWEIASLFPQTLPHHLKIFA